MYNQNSSVVASDDAVLNSTRAFYPAQISGVRTSAPLQQQSMVGQPCGHTPSLFQVWEPPLPQVDGVSVSVLHLDRWVTRVALLILALFFHAYPAFGLHPRLSSKEQRLVVFFLLFLFPRLDRILNVCTPKNNEKHTSFRTRCCCVCSPK